MQGVIFFNQLLISEVFFENVATGKTRRGG